MAMNLSNHHIVALWAADCAERVLPVFEQACPNDARPRNAIKAARNWVKGDLQMTDARKAAFESHVAAREVGSPQAKAAARAAGHAAATAHVATHAPHAADYALKALSNPEAEREWQARSMPETLRSDP